MVSEEYSFFRNSILGKTVIPDGGRSINFYSSHGIIKPYTKADKWPIKAPITLAVIKNNVCSWYFVSKDNHEFIDAVKSEIKKPTIEKIAKSILKNKEQIVNKLKTTNFSSLTDKQLLKTTKEYFEGYHSLLQLPASCRIIDQGIRNILPHAIITKIGIPKEPTKVMKEELEILLLAEKVKKKSIPQITLSKEIKQIHALYSFNSCGYFNEKAKTIQEYENIINIKSRGSPKKDYDILIERFKTSLEEQNKIIKTLTLEEKKIANLASLITLLKDKGKDAYNEVINYSEPLFTEIAKRTGKNVFFIKQLYPEEVEELLNGKIIPEQKILARIQKSAEIVVGTKVELITGNSVDEIEKEFFKHTAQKELKGRIASSGTAKGRACVIISEDHFDDFNKGDILVVQNTNPWHVVLMKKASAIIAEEGGLTSHVAVTSRELGIPCIVGVINATKIIKNGDTVEVDAVKGIIKIL